MLPLSHIALLTLLFISSAGAVSNSTNGTAALPGTGMGTGTGTIPLATGTSPKPNSTTNSTTTADAHPAKPPPATAVLDCSATDGPTLPGGDIDGKAKDFCKGIDGKELTQNTFNFNDTSSWEGPKQSVQGLLLAINIVEDCPGTMTLLGSGCTQAFSSIVSGCAPTATASQKYGGAFTAAGCVEYKVALEDGNVWDPATGPVAKKTEAPTSTGTAPPLKPPRK